MKVAIKYLNNSKKFYGAQGLIPATPYSAGMDLRAIFSEEFVEIAPNQRLGIGSGIALDMLYGTETPMAGFVYSRSGLGAVKGLCVAQGVGVIDPDYRGEIKVFLLNTSQEVRRIEQGERIAQIIFQPYFTPSLIEVEYLNESQRGDGGFGASGKL